MNKQIAMQWAEALESGKYDQCTDVLRVVDNEGHSSFCCLGVLCNLHAQAHPEIAAAQTCEEVYMDCDTDLPKEVMNWAGIEHDSGRFQGFKLEEAPNALSLVDLNDNENWGFKEIAKVIRKYYKEL